MKTLLRCALASLGLSALLTATPARAQTLAPLWPFGPKGLQLAQPRLLDGDGGPPKVGSAPLDEVYITPMRAGQNRVAYWDYRWRTMDLNPPPGGAGVRFYFYDREKEATSFAAYSVREQYTKLAEWFHYTPSTRFPFILYASYEEFQATNVFPISEGTLGATDPRDLRMALPFFGDVHQFSRVSTHEMAHQFSIQKIRDAASKAKVENPLEKFPLWFVEGIAEYSTFKGMDPEGDLIVGDVLLNPDAMKGYAVPDFFDERAGGYIGVYKLGQARLTFLDEVYGHEKINEILEKSYLLSTPTNVSAPPPPTTTAQGTIGTPTPAEHNDDEKDDKKTASAEDEEGIPSDARVKQADDGKVKDKKNQASNPKRPMLKTFEDLVSFVVKEPKQKINERYHAWLKRRYFTGFLDSKQTVADFIHYKPLAGAPDSIAVSDDGRLVLYRSIEGETGLSTLYLQDLRDPSSRVAVTSDQRPGRESLHPVDRRTMDLRGNKLLYAARSGERDVLYLQEVKEHVSVVEGHVKVTLKLSSPRILELPQELLEIYDPAICPDGKTAAIVAIDGSGFRDIYSVPLEGAPHVTRITDDAYAEADLAWDGDRLLFVSDATESHDPNVFARDMKTGNVLRLTHHAAEDKHPVAAMGGVLYRSTASGKPNLWLLKDGKHRQLTDLPTGALMAVPAKDELLTVVFQSGEQRLYRVPQATLLKDAGKADEGPGLGGSAAGVTTVVLGKEPIGTPYPRMMLPDDAPLYQPGKKGNWRAEGGAAASVGGGPYGSVGAAGLAITDLMRDHVVLLNLAVYGTLKLTDAAAMYVNQSTRPELGVGVFHTFEPRRDKTFPVDNFYLQREFGVAGVMRYPVDRFRRIETSLELRGIERFGFTDYTSTLYPAWNAINGGVEPEFVASVGLGHDTTRLHMLAGPVEGQSVLLNLSAGYLPVRQFSYARAQADAQERIRLLGRTNLLLRGAGGLSTGGQFAPQFWLSSIDNLRGYYFGDPRLLGQHYYVANAQLTVPVDWLVATPLLTGIYGIGGFDFGGAFDRPQDAWAHRSLAAVLGANLAMGGMLFELHFGRLLNIGGTAVPLGPHPFVFNLGLRYLYQ